MSKRSEPYFRTPKTALKHMRDVTSHSTPKEALAKLTKEQGGEIETGRPTLFHGTDSSYEILDVLLLLMIVMSSIPYYLNVN